MKENDIIYTFDDLVKRALDKHIFQPDHNVIQVIVCTVYEEVPSLVWTEPGFNHIDCFSVPNAYALFAGFWIGESRQYFAVYAHYIRKVIDDNPIFDMPVFFFRQDARGYFHEVPRDHPDLYATIDKLSAMKALEDIYEDE